MLKTNSKKARENIRRYIVDYTTSDGYDVKKEPETWEECRDFIRATFESEMKWNIERKGKLFAFVDWCQGLPSALDTCYYYTRSAVEDLGAILEETAEEKARFTEPQAEERLTGLIFRELYK